MRKIDYTDPMSMYRSGKTAKVVTEQELAEQKAKREWTHQLNFCKWLKQTHPEIRFRSDVQSAGKLSAQMQNIMQILDPFSGWPDVSIWVARSPYCGLMIEMKRENSGAILKDGSLSKGKHVQNQHQVHEFLRGLGWKVEIAEGCEEAKKVLESYLKLQ